MIVFIILASSVDNSALFNPKVMADRQLGPTNTILVRNCHEM